MTVHVPNADYEVSEEPDFFTFDETQAEHWVGPTVTQPEYWNGPTYERREELWRVSTPDDPRGPECQWKWVIGWFLSRPAAIPRYQLIHPDAAAEWLRRNGHDVSR